MDGKIKMTFSLTALILLIAACLLLMGWRLGLPPFSEAAALGSLRTSDDSPYTDPAALRELRFDLSKALEDESADYVLRFEHGFLAGILKGAKDGTPELLEIDVFSGSLMNSAPQTVVSQLNEMEGSLGPLAWRLENEDVLIFSGAGPIGRYETKALRGICTGGSGALCWLDGTTLHMVFPDEHQCSDPRITPQEAEMLKYSLFRSNASFVKRTEERLIYCESSSFDHMPLQGSDVVIRSLDLASGECEELGSFTAIIWQYKDDGDDLVVLADGREVLRISLNCSRGSRKYSLAELVNTYMTAISEEDCETALSLFATNLYGRDYIVNDEYIPIEQAEKEGMLFSDPFKKSYDMERISKILAFHHSEIVRIWGEDAFSNVTFEVLEQTPSASNSIEIYINRESGMEIDYKEFSRLNNEYWDKIAKDNGITVEELKSKEFLPLFMENMQNEPAGIALKSEEKSCMVKLMFYGDSAASDGSEYFRFYATGTDDAWYIFQGLTWEDPVMVEERPDV
ncbi:MAG: hypothetical protein IJK59_01090 [Firmicutes bacterium]|nr:hypothetical protein [Bacillota bacterium]MBQ6012900.1 hypothetical protein [Bacillota bacterium]MBQ6259837.1 hypothetical protein [Bacillota bacterium]MBR0114070.1 hypothetical protein [Bacillota bacterium]